MAAPNQVRTHFKGPEGRYSLLTERVSNLINFSPLRLTRLSLATLKGSDIQGTFLIFNVGDFLHIAPYAASDKDPVRSIFFGAAGSGGIMLPTCHSYQRSSDGLDLVVGLSSGDVIVASLKAQLQATSSNTKLVSMLHFNADGANDDTRCNAVAWVPGAVGVFVAAHLSGFFHIYSKTGPSTGEGRSYLKPAPMRAPTASKSVGRGQVNAVAAAPNGAKFATASRDGVLRVYEYPSLALTAGFKSHYGGLTCLAWSPDGAYIATGGEDDLVCLYGLTERAVVAWGQGHKSWISAVAFDPWIHQQQPPAAAAASALPGSPPRLERSLSGMSASAAATYRVCSAGQDAQLALWDFTVSDDIVALSPRFASPPRTAFSAAGASSSGAARSEGGAANGVGGSPRLPSGTTHIIPGPMSTALPAAISPPVTLKDMELQPPITIRRIHLEPISDILCTPEAIFTACHAGQVKSWQRPPRTAIPHGSVVAAAPQASRIPSPSRHPQVLPHLARVGAPSEPAPQLAGGLAAAPRTSLLERVESAHSMETDD